MDAKALAKSKRAHSLHHSKKSHPNPKPKPAAGAAGSSKATSEKPAQPRQPRAAPALPSNWDRYQEEVDADAGLAFGGVPSQSSEVPPPKSKGADFRHLIAEARSQPHSLPDPYSDSFPAMDDILPDIFRKGAGPMLSARGEAIVSMAKDGSFIIEDKATSSREVSFLSLNLNVLAEQLAKVDLAKRLFIEADLLPPEVLTEASASVTDKQIQTGKTEAAVKRLDDFDFDDFSEDKPKEDANIRGGKAQTPISAVNKVAVDIRQFEPHNQIVTQESKQAPASTASDLKNKQPSFKVAAAEAELDALLDSLNDTKLTDNFHVSTSRPLPNSEERSPKVSHEVPRKGWEPSKAVPAPSSTNIDILLDDLLEETSRTTNQNGLQGPKSSAPNVSARSKVLDDFDSWLDTI